MSWVPCPIPYPSPDLLNDLKLPVILSVFISLEFSCSCFQPSSSIASFLLTSASTEDRVRCFHKCVVIDCLLFSVSTRLQAPQGQVSCMSHSCLPYSQCLTSCLAHSCSKNNSVTKHLLKTRQGANLFTYIISFKEQNKIRLYLWRGNVAEK